MRLLHYILTLILLSGICAHAHAQKTCTIKKYISADGSLYYVVPHDTIYYTKESRLMAAVITDKENFFLSIITYPKPDAIGKKKEFKDLTLTLANKAELSLPFFDARFVNDSTSTVTFLIDKKIIDTLKHNQIEKMHLKAPFVDKDFGLILHRDLVAEHLACLKTLETAQ